MQSSVALPFCCSTPEFLEDSISPSFISLHPTLAFFHLPSTCFFLRDFSRLSVARPSCSPPSPRGRHRWKRRWRDFKRSVGFCYYLKPPFVPPVLIELLKLTLGSTCSERRGIRISGSVRETEENRTKLDKMKGVQKDSSEKVSWDRTPTSTSINVIGSQSRPVPRLMFWLVLLISAVFIAYTLKVISSSRACDAAEELLSTTQRAADSSELLVKRREKTPPHLQPTDLRHIVFGIGASSNLWRKRKQYIKIWFNTTRMRGYVWLDKDVEEDAGDDDLPPVKISGDTSKLPYSNLQGDRSAIRISRIISETLKLGPKNVRWFVMGDDDTVFVTDNLIRILRKYDHEQMYYIGTLSESHLQNIFFSYAMAYGGGGFAISYPLAKALSKMQDRCIRRYPALYGSDDRMQACMAELGVPLTKEVGFHQYDVYGNLFGLLAAHPVTPFVSMHHLDVVEPIFPNMTRVAALRRLQTPMRVDSAGLLQQSICYHKYNSWTISVSWGYAVQVFRGIFSPREMEMPSRTFLNWYKKADYTAYAFNTRPVTRNPCQKPFVYYMRRTRLDSRWNTTVSVYVRHRAPPPLCRWRMANPEDVDRIVVYKKPDPHIWDRSPRRNCCRVLATHRNATLEINVGVCREGEVTEIR